MQSSITLHGTYPLFEWVAVVYPEAIVGTTGKAAIILVEADVEQFYWCWTAIHSRQLDSMRAGR